MKTKLNLKYFCQLNAFKTKLDKFTFDGKSKINLSFLFVLIAFNSFADAWTATGNNCNWFSNRYKCHVGIKKQGQIGNYCSKTTANCSGVEEECRYSEYGNENGGTNPFLITYARAYAKVNAYEDVTDEFGGIDGNGNQWYAGEDLSFQVPKYAKYPISYSRILGLDKYTRATLKLGKIIFDEKRRKIIISNIYGVLKSNPRDVVNDFAAFSISITMNNSSETSFETESYLKRRIWYSNAFYNNGKLQLGGELKNAFVKVTKEGEEAVVIIIEMPSLEINIPESVDMSLIEVNNGVDNGNKGEGISEKFLINEDASEQQIVEEFVPEEIFELNNYPNPVENDNTNVIVKLPETEEIIVELCGVDGKVIEQIYKGQAKKEEIIELNVNTNKISNGIGYIRLSTNKKVLLRKLIITR